MLHTLYRSLYSPAKLCVGLEPEFLGSDMLGLNVFANI